ncbi:type II toxin-antitoxin system RelE/ParE family toxin [Viscerimonas tarda]
MKNYIVVISEAAREDMDELSDLIMYGYKTYNTAIRYIDGLEKRIQELEKDAESYQFQNRTYFLKYGHNVRRLNYKKMAIIYTVHGKTVYIHRIVPANTISGLSL